MYKYYPTENKDQTLVRNLETNEVFWQMVLHKPKPHVPSILMSDYFDLRQEKCWHVDNNRLKEVTFVKMDSVTYQIIERTYHWNNFRSMLPVWFIVDYYEWHFNKIGLKNYKFKNAYIDISLDSLKPDSYHRDPADGQIVSNLVFNDNLDQAQFEFYFGDIIR